MTFMKKQLTPVRPILNRITNHSCAFLALMLAVTSTAFAETVLQKRRIGNNTEGMTYLPSNSQKDRAIAIDGNDVLSISLATGGGSSKIFDVLRLDPQARTPRGIVYSRLRVFITSPASNPPQQPRSG